MVYGTSKVGMATGRVRAGFFYIRTRPAGQDPWPGPGPLTKRIFFPGPTGPVKGLGPICGPTKKKKKFQIQTETQIQTQSQTQTHKFQIYIFTTKFSDL